MRLQRLWASVRCAVLGMVHLRALPATKSPNMDRFAPSVEKQHFKHAPPSERRQGHAHREWQNCSAAQGAPRHRLSVPQIVEKAVEEAAVYVEAGIDGLIVENMHDIPYSPRVGPEVTAIMATICVAVRQSYPSLPLGVQMLSAANQQAMAVALATDADFIRAEGFVFSQISDEGFLDACASDLLRYRKQIGAEHVQIFADIKKKHSSHALTADVSIAETGRAAEFFLADGVIVTGIATGQETDPVQLKEVKEALKIPVLVGSGVSYENMEQYMAADGFIIGSHFKKAGYWANELDTERIKKFMSKIQQLRK